MKIFTAIKKQKRQLAFHHLMKASVVCAAIVISCFQIAAAADLGLIDAETLRDHSAEWVILDARPKADWEAGHIPGAIQFFWDNYTRTDAQGIEFSSFPPEELAAALSGLGIDEKTPVVVYGDADKSWGCEGYDVWLLTWLGHEGPIRLLKGGIQAWRNLNFPLASGTETPAAKKAVYQINLQPQCIASTEDVRNGNGSCVLVDVRSTFEWIKGRIPGAVRIPWEDFHTGKDRRPLPPEELKKLLARHGVDTSKPVVYYCTGGVRSAYAWMTHQLAGLPDAHNYKGGWAAWEKRSGN